MKIDPGHSPQINALNQSPVKREAEESTVSNGNSPSAVINLSGGAKKLQEHIKNTDSLEEVRPDAVAEAQAELENWNGLSDDQIDQIMNRMIDEMDV